MRRVASESVSVTASKCQPEMRIGKMVYDKDLMKWMRASTRVPSDAEDHISVTDAESEDPFKDVENLREDDSAGTNENVGVAAKEIPTARPEEAMEEAHFKQDMTRIEEGDEEDANGQE
ncbi:hypothetical protein EV363DRAFT_1591100 [Boletus edulis]|nr:hypothetical protein EV363DRAFT_1591100 [Boletus edulis]